MQQSNILQNVRYNFVVNVLDGTFFGLGLGFASSVAVIPLFFATLTDDTALIGFVASLHTIGWYLPQLLTAQYVAKLRRYKPFVLFMTIHERWPFFGLALVAWYAPQMNKQLAIWLALLFLVWHSLGGGLTGTAWQSMIGKIMPANRRGTFWGVQSAAANLMLSGGAIVAGLLLQNVESPLSFALCFLLTGIAMTASFGFLAMAREPEIPAETEKQQNFSQRPDNPVPLNESPKHGFSWTWTRLKSMWETILTSVVHGMRKFGAILKKDANFRWFLVARSLSQVAWMAVAFYTLYATRHLGMDNETSGLMVGLMALVQTASNLILGWIGDHWGHRKVFVFGAALISLSALIAMLTPELSWFYVAFGLAGFANATLWATAMAFTIQFGSENEKPLYIGLTNTMIAPTAIAAPLIGGWIADHLSFQATFLISVVAGLAMASILLFIVREPHAALQKSATEQAVEPTPADLVA
jgi:MFS family permease